MDMLSIQLHLAIGRHRAHQLFASEVWEGARAFIKAKFAQVPLFGDVRTRPIPSVRLHLYGAGPPCQPWAPGGLRRGMVDVRAELFFESLRFIFFNRPFLFLFENSELVRTYRRGSFLRAITASGTMR
jgi:site-specific DNA-cytosine methylase